jgi:hypothetical protein
MAVLAVFSHAEEAKHLRGFTEKEWFSNLPWLDTSGLALYLLDVLIRSNQEDTLPGRILIRLRQNLADNTLRNTNLLVEAIEINHAFRQRNLLFAHVKGITLTPESVPDPSLRCQLDLDFLIDADGAEEARSVLEGMGYKLDFMTGKTWEFRAGVSDLPDLKDLYKIKRHRSTDIHLLSDKRLLERTQVQFFDGVAFPVLSPADQYIAQTKHLFKHLCCAFTRAAWLLECRCHAISRQQDQVFWTQVAERVADDSRAALALGFASLLMTEIFGDVPAEAIVPFVRSVSPSVRLWIQIYSRKALLAGFPGTKLYLLLQAEVLPVAVSTQFSHRNLLPLRLPKRITHGYEGEGLLSRGKRAYTQAHFTLSRLRFHCVEGARYTLESIRFRRLVTGLLP